jgi:putative PIN family toxin of toxin-antitoxin system
MRAVLDTNVLISATLTPYGNPAKVLDAWRAERFDLLLSPPILEEVAEVIRRPHIRKRHGWSDEEIEAFLSGLATLGVVTAGELEVTVVAEDPDDNKFFACAVEGAADYIVSGDPDLLKIGTYQGIQIVTPRQFWEMLSALDEARSSSGESE